MMNWIRGLGREVDLAGFGALGHGGLDHTLCAAKVRSAVFGFLNGSRNAFRLLGRAVGREDVNSADWHADGAPALSPRRTNGAIEIFCSAHPHFSGDPGPQGIQFY